MEEISSPKGLVETKEADENIGKKEVRIPGYDDKMSILHLPTLNDI